MSVPLVEERRNQKEAPGDRAFRGSRSRFVPTDKLIASMHTRGGAPKVDLSAKLIYQDGQVYGEQVQTIHPTGPVTTNFVFPREPPNRAVAVHRNQPQRQPCRPATYRSRQCARQACYQVTA